MYQNCHVCKTYQNISSREKLKYNIMQNVHMEVYRRLMDIVQ